MAKIQSKPVKSSEDDANEAASSIPQGEPQDVEPSGEESVSSASSAVDSNVGVSSCVLPAVKSEGMSSSGLQPAEWDVPSAAVANEVSQIGKPEQLVTADSEVTDSEVSFVTVDAVGSEDDDPSTLTPSSPADSECPPPTPFAVDDLERNSVREESSDEFFDVQRSSSVESVNEISSDTLSNSESSIGSYPEDVPCDACNAVIKRKKFRTTITLPTTPPRIIISDMNWMASEFVPGRKDHSLTDESYNFHKQHLCRRVPDGERDELTPTRESSGIADEVGVAPACFSVPPLDVSTDDEADAGGGGDVVGRSARKKRADVTAELRGRVGEDGARVSGDGGVGVEQSGGAHGHLPYSLQEEEDEEEYKRMFRRRTLSGKSAPDEDATCGPGPRRRPIRVVGPAESGTMLHDACTLPLGDHIVVMWDVESTGLTLNDEICQIGAFCPGPGKFNAFAMPHRDIGHAASEMHDFWVLRNTTVGLGRGPDGLSGLYRKSTGENLHAWHRKDVLARFVSWLRNVSCNASVVRSGRAHYGGGIILMSHGGRGIDVPLLLQLLQKYPVIEAEFFSLVVGFGDSLPLVEEYFEENDIDCPLSLPEVGEHVLGRCAGSRKVTADDAELLYRVIQQISDTDMVEHKHVMPYSYTVRSLRRDLANRKLRALKTRTLHPIFESWLAHPDFSVRSRARQMRATLVAVDCQRRFLERAFWEGGVGRCVLYLRRLVWRMKKLTDKYFRKLREKREEVRRYRERSIRRGAPPGDDDDDDNDDDEENHGGGGCGRGPTHAPCQPRQPESLLDEVVPPGGWEGENRFSVLAELFGEDFSDMEKMCVAPRPAPDDPAKAPCEQLGGGTDLGRVVETVTDREGRRAARKFVVGAGGDGHGPPGDDSDEGETDSDDDDVDSFIFDADYGAAGSEAGDLDVDDEDEDGGEEGDDEDSVDEGVSDSSDEDEDDDDDDDPFGGGGGGEHYLSHLSKKDMLALAMEGTGFTWRQLKAVVVYYVKCLAAGYHPEPCDILTSL